jgi:mannitol-1-phosphate 5-dehydrogenase
LAKKAVQFGAGNIGRGFLGQLYFESGYHTTYVDVVEDLLAGLNARHEYPLRIVDEESYTLTIGNASAIHAGDMAAVARALAEADIASTAVGVNVLGKVAPAIAAGVAKRFADNPDASPLNFIVCENLIGAGPFLREEVRKHLGPELHDTLDTQVGFVEASIGRMVPVMTDANKDEDPLLVCVEEYCELPVDGSGFVGPIPTIKNMKPLDNFGAYVERKLFVHNLSHAAAAYLGYLHGHEYIWQAVEDDAVLQEVAGALSETCTGLAAKHGLEPDALNAHADDLLRRYHNKALGDQIARIAKDPVRKLGPNDRLIGSARMCLEQGIEPVQVAFAAAAAIRYDYADDPAAQQVQRLYKDRGLAGVLEEICQVPHGTHLAELIEEAAARLARDGWVK